LEVAEAAERTVALPLLACRVRDAVGPAPAALLATYTITTCPGVKLAPGSSLFQLATWLAPTL
jgi:hypothetical protein